MPPDDIALQISDLLNDRQDLPPPGGEALTTLLDGLHPAALAGALAQLEPEKRREALRSVTGLDRLAELVRFSPAELRAEIVRLVDESRIAAILRRLPIDDAAGILRELPRRKQMSVFKKLPAQLSHELLHLIEYRKETAGALMTTAYVSLSQSLTVQRALAELRSKLRELGSDVNLSYLYLTDANGHLAGVLSPREILAADPELNLAEIMIRDVVCAAPGDDQGHVARLAADYDLTAVPILEDGKLIGIVTVDDAIDVLVEGHTEDILKLAGTREEELLSASLESALRGRIPWLTASWIGGLGAAFLLQEFSSTLERAIALVFFMPVIFGMGGNISSQSAALTARSLAQGAKRMLRARLLREATVGCILGVIFAALLGLSALSLTGDHRLGVAVLFATWASLTAAGALGVLGPYCFRRVGLDPVAASGPLVAVSTDLLCVFLYLSVAALLL